MTALIQPDPIQEVIYSSINRNHDYKPMPNESSHAMSSILDIPLTLTGISCHVFTWLKHKCSITALIDPSTNYTRS
eukprot:CAMPEP_0202015636 /NCGR_PEP_ID=MMETSP0905-20130828/32473_1 /ASSEMBLY_ACC=CAM_ASM_000554 /TAXON_ID=420261 /ORGANISM="Thalassiosira antarctica, Strain CCMP982" /LENGTH=75 /DNA_ID=CAMNT_0048575833 /DNA_START=25 /DNA_END=252 /DNA_ORIENTATION=+